MMLPRCVDCPQQMTQREASPPHQRFLETKRVATAEDLAQMGLYVRGVGYDKRAFYLSCETLARTGALHIAERADKNQQPLRVEIREAGAVRAAWMMFFADAKTTYCAEKRFLDIKWMLLVQDAAQNVVNPTLLSQKRRLYPVEGVGAVARVSDPSGFQNGAVLVHLADMPNARKEPHRSLEERCKDLAPERLIAKEHIRTLLVRTERFWSKRVRNTGETSLYRSSMEHCFYETLERLARTGALKWDTSSSFTITKLDEWYDSVKLFSGHCMPDSAISWVRLLGWASTDNTVPPPARSLVTKPRITVSLCLTYRKLSWAERQDLDLFKRIIERSYSALASTG